MTMLDQDQVNAVIGQDVYGSDGGKIGAARQVYVDDDSGRPEWVTVATGLFGTKESFIPLADASVSGDQLTVPYTKAFVKDAPNVDEDGHLSPDQERRLYDYYSRSDYDTAARGTADRDDRDADRTGTAGRNRSRAGDRVGAEPEGYDTSGPATDDAITVSEERLNVGTRTEQGGRARLRKYVVTENVTQTVPVSREEVRLEREPITDANRGAAVSGPDISEEEHEVVLHEERPVVQKETVPVERVSLGTETVTEQQTVNEVVRKERVDVDGDVTSTDRS
jgi:uncharacterized protein (TIGR02271 family)